MDSSRSISEAESGMMCPTSTHSHSDSICIFTCSLSTPPLPRKRSASKQTLASQSRLWISKSVPHSDKNFKHRSFFLSICLIFISILQSWNWKPGPKILSDVNVQPLDYPPEQNTAKLKLQHQLWCACLYFQD